MNSVSLVGRLLTDPMFKNGDTPTAKVTLAINSVGRKTYIPCVAFGKTANMLNEYFKKGNRIGVEGEIRCNNFENFNEMRIEVCIKKVHFIDKKGDSVVEDDTPVVPDRDVDDVFGW